MGFGDGLMIDGCDCVSDLLIFSLSDGQMTSFGACIGDKSRVRTGDIDQEREEEDLTPNSSSFAASTHVPKLMK